MNPPPVPKEDGHAVQEFLPIHEEAIFERTLDGVAERADSARDNRDLLHGIDAGKGHGDERVAHLMVSDHLAFVWIEQAIALFQSSHDPFDGLREVFQSNTIRPAPRGKQRCFIVSWRRKLPSRGIYGNFP